VLLNDRTGALAGVSIASAWLGEGSRAFRLGGHGCWHRLSVWRAGEVDAGASRFQIARSFDESPAGAELLIAIPAISGCGRWHSASGSSARRDRCS
jgi:hypothetical protein